LRSIAACAGPNFECYGKKGELVRSRSPQEARSWVIRVMKVMQVIRVISARTAGFCAGPNLECYGKKFESVRCGGDKS
jgi:hypothetical protein